MTDKDELAKMLPLLKVLGNGLQKAAIVQSEMRRHYPLVAPPSDCKRPSQRRDLRKKSRLDRLLNEITSLSKVPQKRIYHELVRAPKSRAKAKATRESGGEILREGVIEAINFCKRKELEPTRKNVRDWLVKNKYAIPSDRHLNRLIKSHFVLITSK